MCRLVCTFVVPKPQRQKFFLTSRPIWKRGKSLKSHPTDWRSKRLKMVTMKMIRIRCVLACNNFVIFQYAFNWINPFPMKFIASRRQQHLRDIKVSFYFLLFGTLFMTVASITLLHYIFQKSGDSSI